MGLTSEIVLPCLAEDFLLCWDKEQLMEWKMELFDIKDIEMAPLKRTVIAESPISALPRGEVKFYLLNPSDSQVCSIQGTLDVPKWAKDGDWMVLTYKLSGEWREGGRPGPHYPGAPGRGLKITCGVVA